MQPSQNFLLERIDFLNYYWAPHPIVYLIDILQLICLVVVIIMLRSWFFGIIFRYQRRGREKISISFLSCWNHMTTLSFNKEWFVKFLLVGDMSWIIRLKRGQWSWRGEVSGTSRTPLIIHQFISSFVSLWFNIHRIVRIRSFTYLALILHLLQFLKGSNGGMNIYLT